MQSIRGGALGCCALGLALSFSGCALNIDLPANRFESPETEGKPLGVKFGGGLRGGTSVELSPDYVSTAPDSERPGIVRDNVNLFLAGAVGIVQRIDLTLDLGFEKTPPKLGLKYQPIGPSQVEAKEGDFSAALTLAFGAMNLDDSGSRTFLTTEAANYQIDVAGYDAAVILGYRFQEHVMVYGGPFHTKLFYEGDWQQTAPGPKSVHLNSDIQQTGFNLGIKGAQPRFDVGPEVSYTWVHAGRSRRSFLYVGFSGSIHF